MDTPSNLDWHEAAMKIGESIGQLSKFEYYNIIHMSPDQWVIWVNNALNHYKKEQLKRINNENH